MPRCRHSFFAFVLIAIPFANAKEPTAAERGQKALLETPFIPAFWTNGAIPNAWKQWEGTKAKPADYDAAFRDRYGLHSAPYPNNDLPMGLRKSRHLIGNGVGIDCMLCHGGSIFGKSIVGLGNGTLDVHALFEELSQADGYKRPLPFHYSNVRGTNEAGGFAVYLLGFRNPDLTLRRPRKELGLHDDLCEDVPAWWLLKKKRTMYFTGATDARSVRSLMQFMMHPLTVPQDFDKAEPAFRDVLAYLNCLVPPKFPFPIDASKAARGKEVFTENCAKCHGTYGETWTYPNKIVPLAEIGTDPSRYRGIETAFGTEYSDSWFGKEKSGWFVDGLSMHATPGYQAPPLDGIWATAPYLHNGSVPTLYDVLNSRTRPRLYTRSFHTNEVDYDKQKIGWKLQLLDRPADPSLPAIEQRKVYDTSKPGRGNMGHTYGDDFTEEERWSVIEYLKTL